MNMHPYTEKITQRSLIVFFLLTFGITWGLSVIATEHLLPVSLPPALMTISAILLHYGPALAAIILVGITGGRSAFRSLLGKLVQWRVGFGWYLFIFLYPLLLRLAAVGIDVLLGGQWPAFLNAADVPAGNPALLIPVVFLAVFFQAGLAEEIGWRGYALPGLQKRYGAVVSSVILGIIWCLWHFHPLNFPTLWPMAGWYLYNTFPFVILLTLVYNNTEGSILLAALFHTASNVSDWIVPTFSVVAGSTGLRPFIIQGTLGWIFAIGVIIIFGAKHLRRKGAAQN
jgi:membrane protease YdiL (CAAX protease family)